MAIHLAQFAPSVKGGKIENQRRSETSFKGTQNCMPRQLPVKCQQHSLTQTNNENTCKVLTPSIDHRHRTPAEHITWNSEPWTNLSCEHDTGNDKTGKGNSKHGEHNAIAFVREVEVGSHSIRFGVGDIVTVEGVEEITS